MSRRDEFKQNVNPAKRFLEWKSEQQAFSYYDKEAEETKLVELPFKFLTLKEMHTVKGWSDSSESQIYSNEVQYIGREELNVRSFKGGEIARGLWKDIKSRVKDFGGHYVISVYIMTEQGEIWNLQLKGSAASMWYEFTAKSRSRLGDEWVEIVEAEQREKGKVKYHVPVFKFNTSINDKENEKAEEVYATLKMYMDAYSSSKEVEPIENVPVNPVPAEAYAGEDHDDLPF